MAPRRTVEFVILRLAFESSFDPKNPRIEFIRRKVCPTSSKPDIQDWLQMIMIKECKGVPLELPRFFWEWRILTGDSKLMTKDGIRYENAMIILGEEAVYWSFYRNQPANRLLVAQGKTLSPVTYCCCCLHRQYRDIIETLKRDSK